jgi:uncharacterized membrane protein
LQIAGKKARKQFPSTQETRLKGTEFEKFAAKQATKPAVEVKAPSKWRQQHNEMMNVVAAVKEASAPSSPVKAAVAQTPVPVQAAVAPATPAAEPQAAADGDISKVEDSVPKKGIRVGEKVVVIEKGIVGYVTDAYLIACKLFHVTRRLTVVLCRTLQFKGPIWGLKKGNWFGVEFHDSPVGRNDGSYLV